MYVHISRKDRPKIIVCTDAINVSVNGGNIVITRLTDHGVVTSTYNSYLFTVSISTVAIHTPYVSPSFISGLGGDSFEC